jgi:hypothetical protein
MSEDEDRERAGDALRKQLVRDVNALADADLEPSPWKVYARVRRMPAGSWTR